MARQASPLPAPPETSRAERTLAVMAITIIGLSVIAILVVTIAPALGVTEYAGGIWPAVVVLPLVGLPIGFLLLIALFILNLLRRSREARTSR